MPKRKKRIGRQEPTFERIGAYDYSLGADCVSFFEGFGVKFTDYQKHELELYLARNYNDDFVGDEYAAATIGISRPRQTGKSYAARFYALWCAMVEGKKVLYSAHNTSTTMQMFKDIKDFLEANHSLYKHLKADGGVYNAPINMGLYFNNGGCISFSTRTKAGARGKSFEVIVIDEAQELTDAQLEALSPTSIASEEDSQMIALGTPPGPECLGTVYRDWYDTAHGGDDDSDIWWMEWAIPKVPPDIFDVDLWYTFNPGMGWRITEKKMRAEATKFKNNPEGFAREYLGYWAPRFAYHTVISFKKWDSCEISEDDANEIRGDVAYGVKFSPDGAVGSISVAIRPDDKTKPVLVELVETVDMSAGVSYFVDWLAPRLKKSLGVVIDGQSNAQLLVDYLKERKINTKNLTIRPNAKEYSDACSTFLNDVVEKRVAHCGYEELTESVTQCRRRPVGKGGAWGFEGLTPEIDTTIVDSAALAVYLARTSKRKPGRTMKVGF